MKRILFKSGAQLFPSALSALSTLCAIRSSSFQLQSYNALEGSCRFSGLDPLFIAFVDAWVNPISIQFARLATSFADLASDTAGETRRTSVFRALG
jgi:hypothetical protein